MKNNKKMYLPHQAGKPRHRSSSYCDLYKDDHYHHQTVWRSSFASIPLNTVSNIDSNIIKNMSQEGVSELKMAVSSARINGCVPRDYVTSEPRVHWDVLSYQDNALTLVDDKNIESNDDTCKFIQDESMPEWAPSLCTNSVLCTSKYPEDDDLAKFRGANAIVDIPRFLYSNGYKSPKNFHNTFRENQASFSPGYVSSHTSLNNTEDFEKLEKYVEALYSGPAKSLKKCQCSVSTSNLCPLSSDNLINCTLDYSSSLAFDTTTTDSYCSRGTQEHQQPSTFPIDRDAVKEPTVNMEEINEAELSMSLLLEWRKKRQRCFDTAMQMHEIALETRSTNKENSKLLDLYVDPSNEFIKTIITPSEYQNCLATLRQNIKCERTEVASADSGFDALSTSQTLDSSNETSPNIQLSRLNKTRLETDTLRETDDKLRSACHLTRLLKIEHRAPKKISIQAIPQKESPTTSLSNVAREHPRSRFDENYSPTRQVPSMIRYFPSPESMRLQEYSNNWPPVFSDKKKSGRFKIDVPKTTLPKASNIGINDLVPSTTCRTESRSATVKSANSTRQKFFVTPGKTVRVNSDGKKRIFFPNVDDADYYLPR